MQEDLKKLGLTDNEADVYVSLMRLGETQVGGIVNDLKIHRQIAYNALDALEKRGMIRKSLKNKIQHYKIFDPEIIVENAKKQELIARRVSAIIKQETRKTKHEHEINIYNGKEGIRKYFLNIMDKMPRNSTLYVMNSPVDKFEKILGSEFIKNRLDRIRRKKNIRSKLLFGEIYRPAAESYLKRMDRNLRELRFLPSNYINPISSEIWDGHVAFISLDKELFIIEITNKEFYNSFINHFEVLWKIGKK